MKKRIFKAGIYGKKGSYSVEDLKSWIGKEFSVTAGHVGDWKKEGYPTTAIPTAGTCKAVEVDEKGFLVGDITYNEFGEKIKEQYPNFSIGLGADGTPNHVALLGYAPPHVKDLDKSFSELSEFSTDLTNLEESTIIEFEEGTDKTAQEIIDEFVDVVTTLDLSDVNTDRLRNAVWEITSITDNIEHLKSKGYTVGKNRAEFDGMTPEEIKEHVKAEFQREQEMKDTKAKMLSKVPPVLKGIVEFAIDKAFDKEEYSNIIEFSENEKVPMATKLKEFSENGNPFEKLFKNVVDEQDTVTEETPFEKAKRIASLF